MRYVGLLRAVNLGRVNKVPMAELRALCAGLGWTEVKSYIASGNVVFSADGTEGDLQEALRASLLENLGVDVPVMVLSFDRYKQVVATCPFEPVRPQLVHGGFLFSTPDVNWNLYEQLRLPSEILEIHSNVAWFYAPEGVGNSELFKKFGAVLGKATFTARNLNTIRKLAEMLDG